MIFILTQKLYGWRMKEAVLDAGDVIMYLEQGINPKKA
jgi:hypothetical protein